LSSCRQVYRNGKKSKIGLTTLICVNPTNEEIKLVPYICARYSGAKNIPFVEVVVFKDNQKFKITITALSDSNSVF